LEKATARHDAGLIVVDETVGTLLTFSFLSSAVFQHWPAYVLGFFLFRVIDVWKPWIVNYSQALPRGWGVMMDDVLGGIFAGVLMGLGGQFFPGVFL
jgi:phosphatidylglycerophosphatase A